MTTRTILAVDGNSLVHRSFHASASTGLRSDAGHPLWAVRGLLSQLVAAVDRVRADVVVVGFDDPTTSLRRDRWPDYKAHRPPKPAALEQQLALAVEMVRALGVAVVVPAGLEADDVLATAAAYAPTVHARSVLVTSDRDAFALIDEHTRVLRILNGGVEASPLLDPDRLRQLTGVRPDQYLDYAALRGDPSDNLPGVPGIGPKTAARLLAEFGTAAVAFEEAGGDRARALLGAVLAQVLARPDTRAVFERTRAAMTPRTDARLALDLDGGPGCLPVPEGHVRRTFLQLQSFALVPMALRALCGIEPPDRTPVPVESDWYDLDAVAPPDDGPHRPGPVPTEPCSPLETVPAPVARSHDLLERSTPMRFPPLPRRALVAVQEALF